MPKFVELNHELRDGMAPYPSLPPPKIEAIFTHEQSRPRYQDKAEFHIGKIEMPFNVGSYLDSPFHRHRDGPDISRIPLEKVAALPALVLDAVRSEGRAVEIQASAKELRGRAVLVRTGWDRRWGTDAYWELGPYLAATAVDLLLNSGAALVGVDFWNVDNTEDPARPAHTRLLAAGILIVENLANLDALPPGGSRFYAVPLRVAGAASFPVRAFAELG